jgi:hypothetical protein
MILVYSDSQVLDLEWLPKIDFGDQYTISHSIKEYVASPIEVKIAFTAHRLTYDYDENCELEYKIQQLSLVSRFVFSLESELHEFHWSIWNKCHRDNVYWVLPGNVNDRPDMSSHIIFWGDWFKTTSSLYKQLPEQLEKIKPYTTKPRYFDALLGSPKPHRDFIAQAVADNDLQDKFVMTYGGAWDNNQFYAKDYFIWEPGIETIGEQQSGTAGPVRYHGVHTGLSRVIPIDVFNDTVYSIVAETDYDNTLSFFTEKTAKPLIARRLFVVFTGYKFLHNLRQLGFKTFGDVIDESYDLIPDDVERYCAAFEQVKQLCAMDQQAVLFKINRVLEHNYRHIMQTDWNLYAVEQIQKLILPTPDM